MTLDRLGAAFAAARASGRPALVCYLMGDGRPQTFDTAAAVLAECDVLELGIPFSDPVADGPTIEQAAVEALARGTRVDDVLDLASRLHAAHPDKPLVLMTYYNLVFKRGLDTFARQAFDAGVSGVILPDVPLEESAPAAASLDAVGLGLVQLASPASPNERMNGLAKATRGFLYVVSSFGTTGAREGLPDEALETIRRARAATPSGVPCAVGFGVSTPEHVRALHAAGADGVIVGSAIVKRMLSGESAADVAAFVRSLRPEPRV